MTLSDRGDVDTSNTLMLAFAQNFRCYFEMFINLGNCVQKGKPNKFDIVC